jgi:carboxymethylenebutenolidase
MRTAGYLLIVLAAMALVPAAAQSEIDVSQLGIEGPDRAKMTAMVFRPISGGPFPVVVILHGSEGVHQGYVQWAPNFARSGYLTIVGCWFGTTAGQYPCPSVPALGAPNLYAARNVAAQIDAAKRLPGAQSDRVGLIGNSLGGGMVALAASSGVDVRAGVAISGAFESVISRADSTALAAVGNLRAPLLILHGTADANVPVREARTYEERARRLGKRVESFYYEGAGHGLPWMPGVADDVFRRSVGFLDQTLRR